MRERRQRYLRKFLSLYYNDQLVQGSVKGRMLLEHLFLNEYVHSLLLKVMRFHGSHMYVCRQVCGCPHGLVQAVPMRDRRRPRLRQEVRWTWLSLLRWLCHERKWDKPWHSPAAPGLGLLGPSKGLLTLGECILGLWGFSSPGWHAEMLIFWIYIWLN